MAAYACELPLGINYSLPDHSLAALLHTAVITLSMLRAFCGFKGNVWYCLSTQEKPHFEGYFSEWLVTTIRPNTWLVLPPNSSLAFQETGAKESTIIGLDLAAADLELMAFVKWYEHNGLHWALIAGRLWTQNLGQFFATLSTVSYVSLGKSCLLPVAQLNKACNNTAVPLKTGSLMNEFLLRFGFERVLDASCDFSVK